MATEASTPWWGGVWCNITCHKLSQPPPDGMRCTNKWRECPHFRVSLIQETRSFVISQPIQSFVLKVTMTSDSLFSPIDCNDNGCLWVVSSPGVGQLNLSVSLETDCEIQFCSFTSQTNPCWFSYPGAGELDSQPPLVLEVNCFGTKYSTEGEVKSDPKGRGPNQTRSAAGPVWRDSKTTHLRRNGRSGAPCCRIVRGGPGLG